MSTSTTCSCGTFAIGACTTCGQPVCAERDCSGRRDARLLCLACLRSEIDAASTERAAAQRRAEDERVTWESTPLDMSEREAFEMLFLTEPDVRQVNSAERVLLAMGPARFEELAHHCLVVDRMAGEPFDASDYKGSSRGIIGKSIRSMKSYSAWTFQNFAFGTNVTGWSFSTDRVWRQSYSGGEGWQSYSGSRRIVFDESVFTALVQNRAAMLRRVIGTNTPFKRGIAGSRY